MKLVQLQNIDKPYFGHEDLARALGITLDSAKVSASRYVNQGLLFRLKRNLYILKERWLNLDREQKFIIANLIQAPSYISLMTALDYYEITTQMQRDFIESIAIKRTKEVEIEQVLFNYTKFKIDLYCEFTKKQGFFVASPEKAFLDAVYLMSLGRYKLDISSIDSTKLDVNEVERLVKLFPPKTQIFLSKLERIREA